MMTQRYPNLVPQGISAELIAEKWGISREANDAFSVQSHLRAARAREEGRFDREIVPINNGEEDVTQDEGIRPDSNIEKLATLKPAFKPDGVITAANSSQITDGAAAVLIMSEEKANELGLKPRARFHTFALAGVDPVMMLTGPIPATTKVLERAKMKIEQMDLVEINEAFAPVVLSWEKEHHPDMEKVNVNGGAIALGHPLGCSGARLMATLLNELERIGRSLRPADDVRRRRHGQRHHHRAPVTGSRSLRAGIPGPRTLGCSRQFASAPPPLTAARRHNLAAGWSSTSSGGSCGSRSR